MSCKLFGTTLIFCHLLYYTIKSFLWIIFLLDYRFPGVCLSRWHDVLLVSGLLRPVHSVEQFSIALSHFDRIGMHQPQHLLTDCQRTLKEGYSLLVFTLLIVEIRQVVET